MRLPRKWVLSLGLMAAAPGVTLAGPLGFLSPNGGQGGSVAAAPRSNQEIANDVASALRGARLEGEGIEIEVVGGTCTLKGQIADSQQRATATRIVSDVNGVDIVDNQLTLMPSAGAPQNMPQESAVQQAGFAGSRQQPIQQVSQSVDNQQVAQRIADAVAGAGLRGYDIQIRYKQGVASLIGDVGSRQEAAIAERATQQVPGVSQVLNQLTVNGQPVAAQRPQGYPAQPQQMMPASRAAAIPAMPAAMAGAAAGAPMYQTGHLIHNRPSMPEYAWPSYAAQDNYAQVTYPSSYDASAWPYIGPFYPYPQVPMGWRKASLEWDDGHWELKFNSRTDKWWWFLDPGNWSE